MHAYNSEKSLAEVLDSVLGQNLASLGVCSWLSKNSTDHTGAIAASMPRITAGPAALETP